MTTPTTTERMVIAHKQAREDAAKYFATLKDTASNYDTKDEQVAYLAGFVQELRRLAHDPELRD